MPDDRSFRVDESDVDELRDQTGDLRLIEAFSNWVRDFAPCVDHVIVQIEDAFAGTQLGEGIGLFEANGLDDYASEDERRRLRSSDEKHDWKRISCSDLNRCYTSPWFFDAKGFVFHLPAFLIAELNDQHPYGFNLCVRWREWFAHCSRFTPNLDPARLLHARLQRSSSAESSSGRLPLERYSSDNDHGRKRSFAHCIGICARNS